MAVASSASGSGRLAGRVALVTGGLGGIGSAIAARFLAEGARLWIGDIGPHIDGRSARHLQLDVTQEADWRAAAARIEAEDGRLDILVNNAGIAVTGTLAEVSVEDWRRTMAVNAEGAFLGIRAMQPLLASSGTLAEGWASVVNLSSILGMVGLGGSSAYSASKGAVRMLSRALAVEFATSALPIRVNAVHPGFVRTAMTEQGAGEMDGAGDLLAALAARTPMGRLATTDEIAAAVLFLASGESSFVTGAEIVIDGGWTAQ